MPRFFFWTRSPDSGQKSSDTDPKTGLGDWRITAIKTGNPGLSFLEVSGSIFTAISL